MFTENRGIVFASEKSAFENFETRHLISSGSQTASRLRFFTNRSFAEKIGGGGKLKRSVMYIKRRRHCRFPIGENYARRFAEVGDFRTAHLGVIGSETEMSLSIGE